MKFTKIFLFTILVIFSLGFFYNEVQADTVSGSVTVTVIKTCSTPLTQTVAVACDLKNGVAAISGSVTRKQTKSDYPGCTFETPVTVDNSTYVGDNCKYPPTCSDGIKNQNETGVDTGGDCTNVCSDPLTKNTGGFACDKNTNGDAAISGSVTRGQTKSDYPGCAFGTPITVDNSYWVSDNCKYPIAIITTGTWSYPSSCPTACGTAQSSQTQTCTGGNGVCSGTALTRTCSATSTCVCSAPLTKNTGGFTCDKNAKGEDAISGSVTRGQTKVIPSCAFETPVTVGNSYWVSDNCKYPDSVCSAPLTKNTGGFTCDKNAKGEDAISGSVTRGQTKVIPSCAFETPVTVGNSYWVSDNCKYPDGGGGGGGTSINGGWSDWIGISCGSGTGIKTHYCSNPAPANRGLDCLKSDGSRGTNESLPYTKTPCSPNCPIVNQGFCIENCATYCPLVCPPVKCPPTQTYNAGTNKCVNNITYQEI